MACNQCGTDLICRLKDYGGNFTPTLQWQNLDGSAHYKTTDGKTFSCNIPEDDDPNQTHISGDSPKPASAPGITKSEFLLLAHLEEKIDTIMSQVESIKEMTEAIFRYTVDEQLSSKKEKENFEDNY